MRSAPLSLALLLFSAPARPAELPDGFAEETVAVGLQNPTAVSIAPDGRLFVSEQGGTLRVVSGGALLPAPALTLAVDSSGERGLKSTAFDPDFASNGFVYLYYTTAPPASHNRVSRFTASGDALAPGSELVLLDLPPLGPAPLQNGGGLHLDAAGKLLVSVGDNNVGPAAQRLDSAAGKLLRIERDGGIPVDNPFAGQVSGVGQAIWAYGLRNAYTFDVQPGTGRIFADDVGDKLFEEIDEILPGRNYGWPLAEGRDRRFEQPVHARPWSPQRCAVVGSAFYDPATANFPRRFLGQYFFADFCAGDLQTLDPEDGRVQPFARGLEQPVDLDVAADGRLYYLSRGAGAVRRIFHRRAPPVIVEGPHSALVTVGEKARFSCAARGTAPLAYRWERDGRPLRGATSPTLAWLTRPGQEGARVRCLVSDEMGGATSEPALLTLTTDHTPRVRLVEPAPGARWEAGRPLVFSAQARDDEDGPLPDTAFRWQVFHGDDARPVLVVPGARDGQLEIPAGGPLATPGRYRIVLEVTDSAGLRRVLERKVPPRPGRLHLVGEGAVTVDGTPHPLPFPLEDVAGSSHTVEVLAFQQEAEGSSVWRRFTGWSDGGAARHTVTLGDEPGSLTAGFERLADPPCVTFPAFSRFLQQSLPRQEASFTAELDVRPTAAPLTAHLGLADGPGGGQPAQAAMVSFTAAGVVLARGFDASAADAAFAYAAGLVYHLRLAVDVKARTYSVWIAPPGGPEVALARDYRFRLEQSRATGLDRWGASVFPTAGGGTVEVCRFRVSTP